MTVKSAKLETLNNNNNNNNNREYLEHLTCTGPKRLHVLYKYIFVNAHTQTRTRTHLSLFLFFLPLACEKIFIKTHSIKVEVL